MNNVASILVLVFLAISFLQSGQDKLFHWKENVDWLKGHFSKTILKDVVPLALFNILILELIAGILCAVGFIELLINKGNTAGCVYGYYGAIFSCIVLIMLLFGQRLAKDYDGARTIVIYFIPAIMVVYWLGY